MGELAMQEEYYRHGEPSMQAQSIALLGPQKWEQLWEQAG